jgi:hypothetical protein
MQLLLLERAGEGRRKAAAAWQAPRCTMQSDLCAVVYSAVPVAIYLTPSSVSYYTCVLHTVSSVLLQIGIAVVNLLFAGASKWHRCPDGCRIEPASALCTPRNPHVKRTQVQVHASWQLVVPPLLAQLLPRVRNQWVPGDPPGMHFLN